MKYFCVSPLASISGQINEYKYFICEARAEIQKYFVRILVQMKTLKFDFEIN